MPFVKTQVMTLSSTLMADIIGGFSVVPGAAFLVTPKVHLFTAGPSPITPANVPADFTEATFVGYAEQALTLPLLGPINLPSGDGIGVHKEVNFLGGAVVSPGQVIIGYWVDDGTSAMYGAEIFASPIPIALPGDFIALDVVIPLTNPTSAE